VTEPNSALHDGFKALTAADVTDLALLPHRFDRFEASVKSEFTLLGDRILPTLDRIDHAIVDLAIRVTQLEQRQHEDRAAILALQALAAKPKRKAKRK
jgi:hypothetical protein